MRTVCLVGKKGRKCAECKRQEVVRWAALAFLALAVAFGVACEDTADRQDRANAERVTTTTSGPAATTTTVATGWEALEDDAQAAREEAAAESTTSEADRLAKWDGIGDEPYGDDPNNDGRFSDVTCGVATGQPANGYAGGQACVYGDGTYAASGIDYRAGAWHWGPMVISTPGQCADESDCVVVWDHATTSPRAVVVRSGS